MKKETLDGGSNIIFYFSLYSLFVFVLSKPTLLVVTIVCEVSMEELQHLDMDGHLFKMSLTKETVSHRDFNDNNNK